MPETSNEQKPINPRGAAKRDPREAFAEQVLEEEQRGHKVNRRLRRAARAILRKRGRDE